MVETSGWGTHGLRPVTQVRTELVTRAIRRGAPPPLWVSGDWGALDRLRVGVIGSRRPTFEQRRAAIRVVQHLSRFDVIVCSGGALGVDGLAHQAALDAGLLTAIFSPAALPGHHPKEHEGLFRRVSQAGVILSPFDVGTRLHLSHFRRRNRVLVQFLDALIVICAGGRSGSLQCAREAGRAGVPVFVIPWGEHERNSSGTLQLLGAGARALGTSRPHIEATAMTLIHGCTDALDEPQKSPPPLARKSAPQVDSSRHGPMAIDDGDRRWQRYAPVAQGPGRQDRRRWKPDALHEAAEDAIYRSLDASAAGLSVEELIEETGQGRDAIASLLLRWALLGGVVRDTWGRYQLTSQDSEAEESPHGQSQT